MKFPKLNSHTRKGFFGKFAVLFLAILCVFTVTFSFKPNEAAAQFIVLDVLQQVKEYVLDNAERLTAVWANIDKQRRTYDFINEAVKVKVAGIDINEQTGEVTINFDTTAIEGAFEYIEKPEEAFRNLISREAAIFTRAFQKEVGENQLPEGFKEALARELAREAQSAQQDFWAEFEEKFQTNITDEKRRAFNDDFTQGGWAAFLEVTQNCASNYECTRITLIEGSLAQQQLAFENKEREIITGDGAQNTGECTATDETGKCTSRTKVNPSKIAGELTAGVVGICSDIFKDQGDEFLETIIAKIGESLCVQLIENGISTTVGAIDKYADNRDDSGINEKIQCYEDLNKEFNNLVRSTQFQCDALRKIEESFNMEPGECPLWEKLDEFDWGKCEKESEGGEGETGESEGGE